MVYDIIELGDTVASEICTPRVDAILVDVEETVQTALERMRGTGYSRLPVTHGDSDEIVGIVHYKDLLSPALEGNMEATVDKFMFKPLFIPESKNVIALLEEMQAEHMQMAIVIDEYGGTEGIITVEDIVEEIVGEIVDESDDETEELIELKDGEWKALGSLEVDKCLEFGWPVQESDDYETIAGWLLSKLDSVPEAGDEFEVDGYKFTIEKMRRNRIQVLKIVRL